MKIQTVITILVVMTGVGVGSYYAYNEITLIVNAPATSTPESTETVTPHPDFRDRIPGYSILSAAEQEKAIRAIYDDLVGIEKNDATDELARIFRVLHAEKVNNKDQEGYVPQGWSD